MLLRLAYRLATEISPRLALKAAYLWTYKGMGTMAAHRRRVKRGELFPPFLFLALTNDCNLRCLGCWIENSGGRERLSLDEVHRIIASGKLRKSYFYTLLGGEPMIYPHLWDVIERHPECYFQIITNGMFFDEANVERIRRDGNVTPLVSVDGRRENNDARRGQGTFEAAMEGLARLKTQQDTVWRCHHRHRREYRRGNQRRLRRGFYFPRGHVSVVLRLSSGGTKPVTPVLRRP